MATLIYNDNTKSSAISVELDWLIRNAGDVQKIVVTEDPRTSHHQFPSAFFFAHLSNGGTFTTRFTCKMACRDWLHRSRALHGVRVEFCGELFHAGFRV